MSPHVPSHGLGMRRAIGQAERSRLSRLVRDCSGLAGGYPFWGVLA